MYSLRKLTLRDDLISAIECYLSFLQQQAVPAETQMHDADGVSSCCRMKNSILLRSRVEFLLKFFCFFLST